MASAQKLQLERMPNDETSDPKYVNLLLAVAFEKNVLACSTITGFNKSKFSKTKLDDAKLIFIRGK
jgi:hypothetical protein